MILVKIFITFLKIGLFTVGSGYSMLVLAQRYIVDNYRWISLEEFTDIIAIAEVTPGPIMINLATFVGSKVAGLKGAVFATAGLVFLPFFCIFAISLHYDRFREHSVVQSIFKVIRPMAIGFIAVAIIKLSHKSITDIKSLAIAVTVIVITYIFKVNPIYTIIGGILLGLAVK